MSVLRELTLNHLAITPSMEAKRIDNELEWMGNHLQQHIVAFTNVLNGEESFESTSYIASVGYSTESGGKSLLQRIWDGIKRIYSQMKEWLGRLLASRKHYLQHNQFQIEKVRKYVKNLDMSLSPTGEMNIGLTVLPDRPADAHDKLPMFRKNVRDGMTTRNNALATLGGMKFDDVTPDNVMDKIHSVVDRSAVIVGARHDGAGMSFSFLVDKMGFSVRGATNSANSKQPPASIVLMNSLIKDYDDLADDDKKYVDEIQKHSGDSDRAIKELQAQVEAAEKTDDSAHMHDTDVWLAHKKEISEKVQALSKVIAVVTRIQRISHIQAFDVLYDDILTILQHSLGCYKLKKHEVDEEDRGGQKPSGERVYK
jgi:hypothetical protein